MSTIEIFDAIERLISDEYDRGADRIRQQLEPECEEQIAEAADAARLKGFEEGYDEAKEVFQKEGIEDVKAQGYDLGYRAGQEDGLKEGLDRGFAEGRDTGYAASQATMDDKKELWRQAGFDAGLDAGGVRCDVRLREQACPTEWALREEAYKKGWDDKLAEVELNRVRRSGGFGC